VELLAGGVEHGPPQQGIPPSAGVMLFGARRLLVVVVVVGTQISLSPHSPAPARAYVSEPYVLRGRRPRHELKQRISNGPGVRLLLGSSARALASDDRPLPLPPRTASPMQLQTPGAQVSPATRTTASSGRVPAVSPLLREGIRTSTESRGRTLPLRRLLSPLLSPPSPAHHITIPVHTDAQHSDDDAYRYTRTSLSGRRSILAFSPLLVELHPRANLPPYVPASTSSPSVYHFEWI